MVPASPPSMKNRTQPCHTRTRGSAADFSAALGFVSLSLFLGGGGLERGATAARFLSEQICRAWVMTPADEMRIFVIWSPRRHLSLRFPLPFIISQVAGWNVCLCWGNHPMIQCNKSKKKCCSRTLAVYLKQHLCKCLESKRWHASK